MVAAVLAPAPNPHTYVTNPCTYIDPLGLVGTEGCESGGATKPVSAPSWKTVKIDMDEVTSGHTATGQRYLQNLQDAGAKAPKDIFPETWSDGQIENAIRQAYRRASLAGPTQYSAGQVRLFMQGTYEGIKIQMWVNKSTGTIESAWPKY
jgi:hypothetical protein